MFCSVHKLCASVSDSTLYGRAILSRYGVILSGPIDFFVFKCCYEFSNFVYCNRCNAKNASISKFALAEFCQCGGAFIYFSDVGKLFRRSKFFLLMKESACYENRV